MVLVGGIKNAICGLKNQWSKRQVLIQLIPVEYYCDFRNHLQLQEDEAGDDAYFQLKKAIIKQFGPKKADGFDKAIARVMTSTPSHLGRQIMSDICPGRQPLSGCHGADTVLGIWRRSLPQVVRNQIADMDFNKDTFLAVFDKADNVWASNKASTSVVSALTKSTATSSDPEVAAISNKKNKNNKPNRGGSGSGGGGAQSGNQGGGQAAKPNRGPRHPDNPPQGSCGLHWKFGKAAWTCADRHNCPWRNYESPRPRHNRNISATEITE